MSQLVSMLTLIGALAAGVFLGRIPGARRFAASRAFAAVRNWTLVVLVLTMGFRIGRTDEVIGNLPTLGLTALAFAASTIAGTVAVLSLIFTARRGAKNQAGRGNPRHSGSRAHGTGGRVAWLPVLKDPLLLLAVLACGFLSGLLLPFFPQANGALLITWILYLLLVVIGIGLGGSGINMAEIVTHPDLFLLPLGTMIGSILGGLAIGLLMRMRAGTAMALASGFGWYSLSGVILTRLDGPGTGAVAFLSNMLRESMALVLIPLFARTRFPYLAIGIGGATSMDVTLVITYRALGERSIPFCLVSGAICSFAVPILVPLFYSIGR
jgi:uncharacterized membrane protein YbjE (DUF340 family)